MTDSNLAQEPPKSAEANPTRRWASLRERVREVIRAEVDRLNPTDDARRALELIIESSLRYSEADGQMKITVVGDDGQPRTIERNGQRENFTIRDLLEELRVSHPVLFKTTAKREQNQRETEEATPAISGKPKVYPERSEPLERDWLTLGSGDARSRTSASQALGRKALFHLRHGKVHLHGWSRRAIGAFKTPAGPGAEATFQFVPYGLDRARALIDGLRSRPLSRREGFALGGTALAALLAIGAMIAFVGDDAPSPQAAADEPVVTGTISTAQAESTPAVTASRARTLRGVPDVIDTATLSLEGEVVRLFGVEWAPGGGKPEDLTHYLQRREVTCEPAGANDLYRCKVGEQDLSRVVLFNGGGKPTAEATPELKAAADKAREAKIGVWSQQ